MDMNCMDEYIRNVLEQVRCRKAHEMIEEEIRNHMEDQAEANMAVGMSRSEALEEAVRDMGDPIEVGVAMDRIHRPALAWDMVLLAAVISIAGIIIHIAIGSNRMESFRFAFHTILGFGTMLFIYRLDYTVIAKYAKLIAGFMIGVSVLAVSGWGLMINGRVSHIYISGISISLFAMLMLYVPVYAAVLYQYRGSGRKGIVLALIWMIIPVVTVLRMPSLNLAVILLFSMAVVFSIAVYKGWFRIAKRRMILLLWGIIAGGPAVFLGIAIKCQWLADYQMARLKAIFGQGEESYLRKILRTLLSESSMIGGSSSDTVRQMLDNPTFEYSRDYIFVYLIAAYGMLAGLLVFGILVFLTVRIFRISLNQKNELGMLVGCGCGTVFCCNVIINIMMSMGFFPAAQSYLPFFSAGGSNIVVSYIMLGIILSIYRYKNILPAHLQRTPKRGRMPIIRG